MKEIICGNCIDITATFPDNYIDLTVTSPPYDNLRDYNGYTFNFKGIANQLYRITKQGGVVVWVVGDATIKGSETGTSFRQALYFKDIGFNLHDTMIYHVLGTGAKGSNYSYWQAFEYMFVLSKGKPKTINRIKDKVNKKYGYFATTGDKQKATGTRIYKEKRKVEKYGYRENVWTIHPSNGNDTTHPAPFPEKLANDHIISWSNENDLVLDPMCGSGTTCKMAMINNRNYIGIDISEEYCEIAKKRLDEGEYQLTIL